MGRSVTGEDGRAVATSQAAGASTAAMNTPVKSGAPEVSTEVAIRRCTTTEEFKACVQLQKQVWNFADIDLIPVRLFVVADKIGGQVLGGFAGNELVGFVI